MGFTRQIFDVKTHLWRMALLPPSRPLVMENVGPIDTWQMVYNQKSDLLYILSTVSGLTDDAKQAQPKNDGVLPFYEVELKNRDSSVWKRLACLPEGLGERSLQLCISTGNASLATEVQP